MKDNHPVMGRASINPYLAAAGLLGRRLLWDAHPESWRSRGRLRRDRNTHAGRTAVILCNGPSLVHADFDLLQRSDAFVFGLNKINLLFDRVALRPDAIVAVNPHIVAQNREFLERTAIPLYLDSHAVRLVGPRPNVTYLHSASIGKFARDCSMSVNQGGTVTFVALQLAYHLGFERVALVGCDHHFVQSGPPNAAVEAAGPDESHFDPGYFPPGATWQLPDLVLSEMHYLLARQVYESAGRVIVNCTDGGRLEVFPRTSLAGFLGAGT